MTIAAPETKNSSKRCLNIIAVAETNNQMKTNVKDSCCSKDDEKVSEDGCQDACCSREEKEAAEEGGQNTCCSEENEKSNGRRGVSVCCEGKASPCCDGRIVIIRIIMSTNCPQHHASTESRSGSAKATVVKTPSVTCLAPRVPPASLIRSALVISTRLSWLPLIASARLSLLSAKSLAASQRHSLLFAEVAQ